MTDLSILIPARNEEFLGRTIQDILEHIEGNTEVIAVLDGYIPDPPLKVMPGVIIIYNPESVGQRAATNQAAKLASGKYLMKVDAHCAFDQGFDRKMLEAFKEVGDDVTMIPMMKNLHAFDWVCKNGHTRYQSPSGVCEVCKEPVTKDLCWIAKDSPKSIAYRFDTDMHFQYWNEYGYKQDGDIRETMSIQGSCFMCTKKKYFELDLCGEYFSSWGQQGVEVACKTWLSGGRVLVNLKTWYAHMFRTRGGDFGFPYPNPQSEVAKNRDKTKQLFMNNQWDKAIHTFEWLIDKFNPPGWESYLPKPRKGIIYYTDNQLPENIFVRVQKQLESVSKDKNIPIVCASLKKMQFGRKSIFFPSFKRSPLSMFKQIVSALENSLADIIFFTEHDVLYHPSHFDFEPADRNTFYYNENVWYLRLSDGHCLHYDVKQLSGLCGYREALLAHFRERVEMIEKEGYSTKMGYEPMTHNRIDWKNKFKSEGWKSEFPNVDIRHDANATGQRWKKEEFRNQQLLINWIESDEIPGWGKGKEIV